LQNQVAEDIGMNKIMMKPRVTPRRAARIGIALTLFLFCFGYFIAWRDYHRQFLADAAEQAADVVTALQDRLLELDGLRRFIKGKGSIDGESFREYVQPILKQEGIQALAWAPVVLSTRRAAEEQSSGTPDFRFTQRTPDGSLVTATARSRYYPVTLVEPLKGNEQGLGYDLGSEPDRDAALSTAEGTGQITATTRITLIDEHTPHYGFLVFAPVYDNGINLRGFAVGVFRASKMLEAALRPSVSLNFNTTLTDISSSRGGEKMYRHEIAKEIAQQLPGLDDLLFPQLTYTRDFLFAGRQWRITSEATRGYHADTVSLSFLLILPVGLLITRLSYLYLRQLVRSREEVEKLVGVRTAELATSNSSLLEEIHVRQRTEEALRASRDQFQTFFERIGSTILLIDPATDAIIDGNEAAEQFYGYSRAVLRTMRYAEINRNANKTTDARTHQTVIRLHRLADGSFRSVEVHSSLIAPRNDSESRLLFAIIHDITTRQEMAAEQELHQLHLGIAMDLARLAYWEYDRATGSFTFDDRCYAQYATTAEQEGGEKLTLTEYIQRFVHPEDAHLVTAAFTGESGTSRILLQSLEYRILRRDGELRHLALFYQIVDNESRHHGATQDITELKLTRQQLEEEQQALAQSRNHMQTILDNLPMQAWLKDREGRLLMVNHQYADAVGRPREEILGRTVFDLWPHDQASHYHAIDAEIMLTGISRHAEEQQAGPSGAIWFEAFKSPLISADGTIVGTTGMAQDITLRKQTEELILVQQHKLEAINAHLEDLVAEEINKNRVKDLQLMRQEKLASIGQLAAGVAHEINTPLGFISSNIGVLDNYFAQMKRFLEVQRTVLEITAQEEQRRELSRIERKLDMTFIAGDVPHLIAESLNGVERVSRIVNDLKSFSRVDTPNYESAILSDCLESALIILTHELQNVATIQREYQPLPPLFCNPGDMNQLFLNLLRNAGQSITPPGEITLKCWHTEGSVHASVTDTGHGIPDDIRERIFEPFFTTKEVGQGTGLGLSVCHDIMTKHLGELRMESSVGVGTTFTVTLPLREEDDQP
jgi:PAS domain S-box-containing protein